MIEFQQTDTFRKWRIRLKDEVIRARIASRLDRLALGNVGDVKPVGSGISELLIDYGPGYRVYFHKHGNTLILLLCGGNKGMQAKDIEQRNACCKKGAMNMTVKLSAYDPAEDLESDEAIAIFMAKPLKPTMSATSRTRWAW